MDQFWLAVRWYFAIQAFGIAALPLCSRVFRLLPDRGYGMSKALGLLLSGWLFWISVSVAGLPNSAGSIIASLAILLAAGIILASTSSADWLMESIPDFRYVLAVELLFVIAFGVWCLVRARMPQIQTAGGEKWMEIAFLRALLRSPSFPPHDPWLSGFAISYYYFGYVLISMLTRLASVPPSIVFNLGVATVFALSCTGAYSLVYNLLAFRRDDHATPTPPIRHDRLADSDARRYALFGPLILAVVGNLEGFLEMLHVRGIGGEKLWAWLDIRSINAPPPAGVDISWIPTRFFWWWQASRVIRDYAPWGDAQEVIDEFPSFSFILGDLHPHLLALPFVLLALALAMHLFISTSHGDSCGKELRRFPLNCWEFTVCAICLGGLGFLNTWDFPIYVIILISSYAVAALIFGNGERWATLRVAAKLLGAVTAVGILAYLPFWIGFQSQAGGVLLNVFNATRLSQFGVMFGPLLAVILPFVAIALRSGRGLVADGLTWAARTILITVTAIAGLLLVLAAVGGLVWIGIIPSQGVFGYLDAWLRGAPIPGLETLPDAHAMIQRGLLSHVYRPWTPALLFAIVSGVVTSLFLAGSEFQETRHVGEAFVLLLAAIGALLAVSVEFIYLRDSFGTRMNTVFKFYFQTWVLWAVVAAYALAMFLHRKRRVWASLGVLVVVLGLVYPLLAIPARANEYGGRATLDGTAYLSDTHPDDYEAIQWLNQNVSGMPVVLEAPGDRYRAYVFEGRVSANTGLPTVLGWGGHEHQWRGGYDEPARREPDIEQLYRTSSPDEALTLLDRYDISYVYVGPLEQQRYPAEGLEKFASFMETVYSSGSVTIYRR
ncbi:MAG: DUF2298 domain-containing protein [Anaerolineae bacterium]|nr:DUF2298 domain-containing protein [Anaerolineae bacterium]